MIKWNEGKVYIFGWVALAYALLIFIANTIRNYKLNTDLGLPNTFGYCLITAAICFK